jgi:hypothetical protein
MAHPRHEQAIPFPDNGGAADEVSPDVIVAGYKNVGVQIEGTFTATVIIRGRLSASASFQQLTSVTGPTLYAIPNDMALQAIQVEIDNHTGGTVEALFAGRLAQF